MSTIYLIKGLSAKFASNTKRVKANLLTTSRPEISGNRS